MLTYFIIMIIVNTGCVFLIIAYTEKIKIFGPVGGIFFFTGLAIQKPAPRQSDLTIKLYLSKLAGKSSLIEE